MGIGLLVAAAALDFAALVDQHGKEPRIASCREGPAATIFVVAEIDATGKVGAILPPPGRTVPAPVLAVAKAALSTCLIEPARTQDGAPVAVLAPVDVGASGTQFLS